MTDRDAVVVSRKPEGTVIMPLEHIFETNDGQYAFEVRIYNHIVRELVKDNRHHEIFDDQWADGRCHGVVACSADEAKSIVEQRYPTDQGFVVADVVLRN